MSDLARELPYREIWLEPFCAKCWTPRSEITWCQHDIYEPCPDCGRAPLRYALDRRHLRKEERPEPGEPGSAFEFLNSVYCGQCNEEYIVKLRDGTTVCDACGAVNGKPQPPDERAAPEGKP